MDKPKFVAKTSFSVQKIPTKKYIHVFNVTGMTLENMGRQLQSNLSAPRAWLFKGWQNRSAQLDVEYQRILLDQINNMREINAAFVQFQAEAIISYEMIEMLIANKRAEFLLKAKENALKILQADQEITIAPVIHDDRKEKIRYEQKLREKNLESLDVDILLKRAELSKLDAHTKELRARADLITRALGTVKLDEFPPALQTYIISSIFNPNGQQFNDFEIQSQIKDLIIEQEKIKTEKQQAEKESTVSQSEVDRAKGRATIFEINQIRNTDKG